MPDLEMTQADTLPDGQAQTAEETAAGAPEMDTAHGRMILGKYKSIEDAEKGIAEEQKLFGRQADELGRLRQEVEQLRQQSQLKDVLSVLAQQRNQPKEEPVLDMETFTNQLGEKWMEDGKGVSKQILGVANSWVTQSERKQMSELEAMRQELQKTKAEMAEAMERMSPEYQQHKEVIDTMVSEGVPLSTARKLVKKLAAGDTPITQVQRNSPPASVIPTRTIMNDKRPQEKYLFSQDDMAILRAEFPEKTEKDIAEMAVRLNQERVARAANGEPIVDKSFKPLAGRRGY